MLAALQAKVIVSEVPDYAVKRTRVEIVAGVKGLDQREWAALHALRTTLTKGTRRYTRFQLLQYATLAGDPIRVTIGSDHIRIGFSVPARDMTLALDLTDELMREALLAPDDGQAAIDELPFRRRSPWAEAWAPISVEPKGITPADVSELYRKVFAPGNVSIALGGAVSAGDSRAFVEKFAGWTVKPETRRRFPGRPAGPITSRSSSMSTVSIEGPELGVVPVVSTDSSPSDLLATLLAVAMLGQGKGSTAFQVLRQTHGWSYRQEAFVRGSEAGIRPVLVFGVAQDPTAILEKAKAELVRAVDAWTEVDRQRALRFWTANQELNLGFGTLYFAEERPLTESLDDRTFLSAYWRLKTGRGWEAGLGSQANLGQAKAIARRWLEGGTVRVIRGAGGVPGG